MLKKTGGAFPAACMRAFRILFCAAIALSPPAAVLAQSAPRSAAAGNAGLRATLRRVVSPSRGLPGFGPNAIEGLFAEYSVVPSEAGAVAAPVFVWASREAVWFDPVVWKAGAVGTRRYRGRQAPAGDPELPASPTFFLVAFDRPFAAGGLGALPEEWTLVFALPEGGLGPAVADAFMSALLDRFAYFLSLAKSPDDASFPALVER
ncbi:MAG: hypothetical protein A2Z99_02845 [Treponema sp. GWB1_62_6]|nr:MAG: hypothetical protein A2Y36_08370 [Treponema sp. GWA1_62_8]OHE69646.1 MAG: hypothetical protein A2001_08795 [Treponema sp. GWC1_61_84]OHE71329.1 MAG: hypothetical protein A2Z99_02845 [Treponema sp. GWB1_62_6]HCM25016.1 hypothetical protein [Treponema sp.]